MTKAASRCPVCRKPADPAHAPFCSEGCRNRDLIAWLDERYVVPGRPLGEDDEPARRTRPTNPPDEPG